VQASTTWAPPNGTLGRILDDTRRRLPSLEGLRPAPVGGQSGGPSLYTALRTPTVSVIAELKRRSPSKGMLNSDLDAGAQARSFVEGGAAAVSVLTEPTHFGGSIQDLRDVQAAVRVPVLKKDFHIHESQLIEAQRNGAIAVLLIARALSADQLRKLMKSAAELRLQTVIEVRSESELDRALESGADVIGVNSRNLETLEVDERVPERIMPLIPENVAGIWESGVHSAEDVRRAAESGVHAVLVGSALSRSADPRALVRSLTGVARSPRHG